MSMLRIVVALCFVPVMAAGQTAAAPPAAPAPGERIAQPTRAEYLRLAGEVDRALHQDVLDVWFPRSIDREHGGFHSHYSRDWQRLPSDGKFSVFQGRMTWVASQVVMREPALRDEFRPTITLGLDFLEKTMWDRQDGGFYWGLDDDGRIVPQFSDGKDLYGVGFCIYGAAAAYQATHDPRALALAQKGFQWADVHAHDRVNGGYFEWLERDGTPVVPHAADGTMVEPPMGVGPENYKSMNTHIHLLEAFTELYRVWPDATVRARVEELLGIVRDRIAVEPGAMNLYFTNAWRPIPGDDSYGHDVETAYLMLETDELLHGKASDKTERMAKMLVDHALAYGWDAEHGGFYQYGAAFGPPEDTHKEWWVQCEGLNALLLMHERYGRENRVYFQRFLEQWAFIAHHTIDGENHGLWNLTTADGTPVILDKGSIWKAAYHDSRAFWNVRDRLRRLAGE
ncbi:MAG TPA: AGE family epimerase/isomerase [Acidobacteriaceae bacterium]